MPAFSLLTFTLKKLPSKLLTWYFSTEIASMLTVLHHVMIISLTKKFHVSTIWSGILTFGI